ncbi:MAG: succinate dehydrogenase, hydrophobic membrane anchor protein [Tagaea sp.]|nr:succinate dehydrogenase, hydrophobic membrane anchor protein [Azospirillum sp.]MCA3268710.1 succinate dehydrogenase, hydrophobic membrane anchor protein [Azospirillum sp.]MCZ8121975.1 succinate dehydrogenase, hydrophobic membrane anchor protein [Magnetospirillum sp.]
MQGKSLRSPLGRVRGLGSAKDGTHHWWAQRVTAIALVPLLLWFVASVVSLAGAPLAEVKAWLASPIAAVLLLALIVAVFHHAQLGLQVVIEDYVHAEGVKIAALLLVKGAALLFGGLSAFSVLKLAFGG